LVGWFGWGVVGLVGGVGLWVIGFVGWLVRLARSFSWLVRSFVFPFCCGWFRPTFFSAFPPPFLLSIVFVATTSGQCFALVGWSALGTLGLLVGWLGWLFPSVGWLVGSFVLPVVFGSVLFFPLLSCLPSFLFVRFPFLSWLVPPWPFPFFPCPPSFLFALVALPSFLTCT
jgi:hypothetical protein